MKWKVLFWFIKGEFSEIRNEFMLWVQCIQRGDINELSHLGYGNGINAMLRKQIDIQRNKSN
jgi:hypothetical protein